MREENRDRALHVGFRGQGEGGVGLLAVVWEALLCGSDSHNAWRALCYSIFYCTRE